MVLTSAQWEMLQSNGSFAGMNVNASQGADGSFTIKMSEAEWNVFQSNQSSTVTKQQADPQQLQVSMDASKDSSPYVLQHSCMMSCMMSHKSSDVSKK